MNEIQLAHFKDEVKVQLTYLIDTGDPAQFIAGVKELARFEDGQYFRTIIGLAVPYWLVLNKVKPIAGIPYRYLIGGYDNDGYHNNKANVLSQYRQFTEQIEAGEQYGYLFHFERSKATIHPELPEHLKDVDYNIQDRRMAKDLLAVYDEVNGIAKQIWSQSHDFDYYYFYLLFNYSMILLAQKDLKREESLLKRPFHTYKSKTKWTGSHRNWRSEEIYGNKQAQAVYEAMKKLHGLEADYAKKKGNPPVEPDFSQLQPKLINALERLVSMKEIKAMVVKKEPKAKEVKVYEPITLDYRADPLKVYKLLNDGVLQVEGNYYRGEIIRQWLHALVEKEDGKLPTKYNGNWIEIEVKDGNLIFSDEVYEHHVAWPNALHLGIRATFKPIKEAAEYTTVTLNRG